MFPRRSAASFRTLSVALILAGIVFSGCTALGYRRSITEDDARALLTRSINVSRQSNGVDRVCALAAQDASACWDTIAELGDRLPDTDPDVACVVPVEGGGPLRKAIVLVLSGRGLDGAPYTTEFIVFHDGEKLAVLDPVWWSGLTVVGYSETQVTYQFDSSSTLCATRSFPAGL